MTELTQEEKDILEETEIQRPRMEICRACDEYNSLRFCNQCKCFMPFKTALPFAKCPLKKW